MDLLWVCVGIHLTRPSIFVAIFFARKTQIIDHFARKTAKIFYYIQPQKILKGPTFWKILSDGFLAFAPFGKKIKGFIMKILKVDTHSMPRKSFFIKKCCNDTVKLQYNVLAPSAAKRLLYWSWPLFLDHFYIYNKKRSAAKRPVYWIWPLFSEDGKLEFDCGKKHLRKKLPRRGRFLLKKNS